MNGARTAEAAAWSHNIDSYTGLKGMRRVLLVAGIASDRARQEFGKAGWILRTGLRS
jgi:hypothetical protein